MKRTVIIMILAAILSLAIVTPALADKGGVPNESAEWGQLHKAYREMHGTGSIGDVMSNSHWGHKDENPPPYKGGIQEYIGDSGVPLHLDGD